MASIDRAVQTLRAAGDSTRARILVALARRPLCVCELVALVEVGQPAVSRHLGILQRAGLIQSQRDGWWVEYRLADLQPDAFARDLVAGLREAVSGDTRIERFYARVDQVDRQQLASAAPDRSCRTRKSTGENG